jgi:hypothetical protein
MVEDMSMVGGLNSQRIGEQVWSRYQNFCPRDPRGFSQSLAGIVNMLYQLAHDDCVNALVPEGQTFRYGAYVIHST